MYTYSWVDVYVCEGVYVLCVCRETDIMCFCQSLSTSMFEISLTVNLDLHQFTHTGRSGALGVLFVSDAPSTGITIVYYHASLLM